MSMASTKGETIRPHGRRADPAKREAILIAAAAAFFRDGYQAASIEGIAQDAGVSKVTVYNQFGDKEGIFAAAVERELERIRALLVFDEDGGSIAERLIDFGEAILAFFARPEVISFDRRIAAETEQHPEIGRRFLEAGPKRMHAALSNMLRCACDRGELRMEDTMLAAEQLVGMFKGMSDVERRFGATVDAGAAPRRVRSAVAVFMKSYGTG